VFGGLPTLLFASRRFRRHTSFAYQQFFSESGFSSNQQFLPDGKFKCKAVAEAINGYLGIFGVAQNRQYQYKDFPRAP